MIDKPTVQQTLAFSRLENDPDFMKVMEFIKEEESKMAISLKSSIGNADIHRLQGACLVLDSLIAIANEAREVIRESR